jgi:hypothetical protein
METYWVDSIDRRNTVAEGCVRWRDGGAQNGLCVTSCDRLVGRQ